MKINHPTEATFVRFEIYCSCGEPLQGRVTAGLNDEGEHVVVVKPCRQCLRFQNRSMKEEQGDK